MYDARSLANAVLERAWDVGRELTNLDLQKIVYFMHGHFLVEYGEPLIKTEFEAWDYGPVQSTLYHALKRYGREPVEEPIIGFDPVRRQPRALPLVEDPRAIDVLDRHLENYMHLPASVLVDITHGPGTPWTTTREDSENAINIGMKISDSRIRERFEGLVQA